MEEKDDNSLPDLEGLTKHDGCVAFCENRLRTVEQSSVDISQFENVRRSSKNSDAVSMRCVNCSYICRDIYVLESTFIQFFKVINVQAPNCTKHCRVHRVCIWVRLCTVFTSVKNISACVCGVNALCE